MVLDITFRGNCYNKVELAVWVLQELPLLGPCESFAKFDQLN